MVGGYATIGILCTTDKLGSNMLPSTTTLDIGDCHQRKAISFRGNPLRFFASSRSNLDNLMVGKRSAIVRFPSRSRSMQCLVGVICFSCVPPQIFEMAITSVSVVVARIKFWRSRSNESGKYKPINPTRCNFRLFGKSYRWISNRSSILRESSPLFSNSPFAGSAWFLARPHTSIVTNAVTRIPLNWTVLNSLGKFIRRHDRRWHSNNER